VSKLNAGLEETVMHVQRAKRIIKHVTLQAAALEAAANAIVITDSMARSYG